jgi:hypothetical protein
MSRFRVGVTGLPSNGPLDASARSGAAARVRLAGTVVAHDPWLWALGALSFAVRGGWLLLAVPIITFPGDGQLSTIFAPVLTTSGPSFALVVLLAIAAGTALIVACLAVLLAAVAEVAAFERTVDRLETLKVRSARFPREAHGRGRIVPGVAIVLGVGLGTILALAGLAGRHIPQIVTAELQFPSNSTDSLVTRVLGQVRGDLLVLAAVVVLVDGILAIESRHLMASRLGLSDGWRSSFAPALRRVPRLLLAAIACWTVTFAALVSSLWAISVSWMAARDAFLAPAGSLGPDVAHQVLTLAVFVLVWIGALLVAGLASALRAALWTTSYLA